MKTVSPHALYETKISSGELQPDEGQADAVMHLENLFEALQPAQHSRRSGRSAVYLGSVNRQQIQ